MPYKNIVFAKLEKRLLNDWRWYMMSENSQLNYVRLILLAAETYNKIPKNIQAIKMSFRTNQDVDTLQKSIDEIKMNFPKFKENKNLYYFEDFESKTNYIPDREIPGKSQGLPKDVTDIDIDKEEEQEKNFKAFYSKYPKKQGKEKALKAFIKISPNDALLEKIMGAVEVQSKSEAWQKEGGQYIPMPATWLNGKRWEDEVKSNGDKFGNRKLVL